MSPAPPDTPHGLIFSQTFRTLLRTIIARETSIPDRLSALMKIFLTAVYIVYALSMLRWSVELIRYICSAKDIIPPLGIWLFSTMEQVVYLLFFRLLILTQIPSFYPSRWFAFVNWCVFVTIFLSLIITATIPDPRNG